ncbi:MAG: helix-turn-helix domain-containing protein [Roseburia sp.]|nr:helix-turn-helix domain-containing protein [Roseburia sp.]
MKLYEKLSALRKSHNYTQEQLAKKLSVTRQTVSKWEMGISEPSLDLLDKIAGIYNCTVDELMGRSDKNIIAEKPIAEAEPKYNAQTYKEPFWNIYKEAFLVLIVGIILTGICYFVNRYSLSTLSITAFIAIECPIFIIGTIVTVISDERIKTKSGMLDLILPLVLVVGVQILFGVLA